MPQISHLPAPQYTHSIIHSKEAKKRKEVEFVDLEDDVLEPLQGLSGFSGGEEWGEGEKGQGKKKIWTTEKVQLLICTYRKNKALFNERKKFTVWNKVSFNKNV